MKIVMQNSHNAIMREGMDLKKWFVGLTVWVSLFWSIPIEAFPENLLIFAGAASKPPTEVLAKLFQQTNGVQVRVTFGGSGFILSQMKLTRKGDVYFPGSSDFMEKAKQV
jgi:molybdate transport system substrate-binding protein